MRISLFWAPNRVNKLPEVRCKFSFHLIGKSTMASLMGQSYLKSGDQHCPLKHWGYCMALQQKLSKTPFSFSRWQVLIFGKQFWLLVSTYNLNLHPMFFFRPKLTVIIVKKRISARLFTKGRNPTNPPPGTVADTDITRPQWYECSHWKGLLRRVIFIFQFSNNFLVNYMHVITYINANYNIPYLSWSCRWLR